MIVKLDRRSRIRHLFYKARECKQNFVVCSNNAQNVSFKQIARLLKLLLEISNTAVEKVALQTSESTALFPNLEPYLKLYNFL